MRRSLQPSCLLLGAFLVLGSILASPAGAALNRWTSGGPYAGAVVTALAFDPADPAVVYAGTTNGVFRSGDHGATWTAASSGLAGAAVSVLAADPRGNLYAATDGGLQKSVDRGHTWQDPMLPGIVRAFAVDRTNPAVLYSELNATLQKSTDGGATWNGLSVLPGQMTFLAVDPAAPANVYAGTFAGLYRSADGGGTWSLALGPDIALALAIDPVHSQVLYAGGSDGVFKSSDRGLSWSRSGLAGQHVYAVVADPASPSTLLALGGHGIYRSRNAGKSWDLLDERFFNAAAVAFDPSSASTYLLGTYGGFYRSTDRGASWFPSGTGLAASFISTLAVDPHRPGTLYATVSVLGDLALYKSRDAGASWILVEGLPRVNAVAPDPAMPSVVYATTDTGFFRSPDGGTTWTRINASETRGFAFVVDPRNPSILYRSGYGLPLRKSVDGGLTWSAAGPDLAGFSPASLVLAPSAPETLYAAEYGVGFFKSADGGESWTDLARGLPSLEINALAVDPRDAGVVYAALANRRIFKSTDGGETWSGSGTGLPYPNVEGIAVDPSEPSRVYAANGLRGIFRSTNAGATWSRLDEGMLDGLWTHGIVLDPVNPFLLYASTYGGGVLSRADLHPGSSLALNGDRFLVETSWATGPGVAGRGRIRALTPDTAYAWFFQEPNVEVLLKVLDGCDINGRFWVFAAGLTDVRTDITVADTQTGAVEIYHNPPGRPFQPIQDVNALACNPATRLAEARELRASSEPLLLRNGRFRVTAELATSPGAPPQLAEGAKLTDDAAYLWFFDPDNVEVFLKVVDGCTLNGRFWVFAAGLTDVELRITVEDTRTGASKVYENPRGTAFRPVQDTSAFAGCG